MIVELKEKPVIRSTEDNKRASKRNVLACLCASAFATVLTLVLALGATLATLEFVFALAHVGEDTVARPDPLLGYAHLENQTVTFRFEGFSRSRINSCGFRDQLYAVPKPAGTQRICIVGDSMTMGLEVPLANTFPKLLERRLRLEGKNIEVLNCGMSGTGTGQQYLGYRRDVAPLQPDMLIVAYHLGDTDDNVGGGTNPPRPTFMLGDGKKLQVDFQDVDKWLAGEDSRFYSSFDWLRRNSRVLAVLNKLDLDLHADPTYKILTRIAGKPISVVWSQFLKSLPAGNWHADSARQAARDLLPGLKPESASSAPPMAKSSQPAIAGTSNSSAVQPRSIVQKDNRQAAAHPASAEVGTGLAAGTRVGAGTGTATAISQILQRPENGDLNAYRGLLYVHLNRMAVTKEVFRRLNQDCRNSHCELVIAALPAYDNSIMYYREVNELRRLAAEEHFRFINSCPSFPSRGPLDESPYHFAMHFNRAGHARMCELLYQALFAGTAGNRGKLSTLSN